MNFEKYIKEWSSLKFDRNSRFVLLIVYGLIMFSTIASEINTVVFILLFVVIPAAIYFYVKKIFPKNR
ncbi:MAG: hypothetical protein U9Q33_04000 [Campylobacterota bacterium]|nr:hypothetical protein [Campylobacterota bacterium]